MTNDDIEEIIANASYSYEKLHQKFFTPLIKNQPILFEDVLLPWIFTARKLLFLKLKIHSINEIHRYNLSLSAYKDLERMLLVNLNKICERTLYLEFSKIRPQGFETFAKIFKPENSKSKKYYNLFVNHLHNSKNLIAFLKKYPVLARLIATTIEFWIATTKEILLRYKLDYPKLKKIFKIKQPIIAITTGLSDPHHQGRSVLILKCSNGVKIVYKPKNLDLDIAYYKFLKWCNTKIPAPKFKILKILNKTNYGWQEFVEYIPLKNKNQLTIFYEKAGRLLTILYLLKASDCHYENFIAHGEDLMLIDAETLFQAQLCKDKSIKKSVLTIGLLPQWFYNKRDSRIYNIGGIGSSFQKQKYYEISKWALPNTDDMYQTIEHKKYIFLNLPLLQPYKLQNYAHDFISGFQFMYRFFIYKRKYLLNKNSILKIFLNKPMRYVLRNTQDYLNILQQSYNPIYLIQGSNIINQLKDQSINPNWTLLQSEKKSLEQMDIPYFSGNTTHTNLNISTQLNIKSFFKEPSYFYMLNGLMQLSEEDLFVQTNFVKASFQLHSTEIAFVKD